MPDYSKRTGYAPWSLTREAGVQSATVNGTIDIPQTCQPTINTGIIDEKGNWQGVKSNDEVFVGITRGEAIPNSGTFLFPDTKNFPSLDMTGFTDMFIAIKTTSGGTCAIEAVMGPDTETFANLSPVDAGRLLKGNVYSDTTSVVDALFQDNSETLYANVWNIFYIQNRLQGQKNLQFKLTNTNMGSVTLEAGIMRLV